MQSPQTLHGAAAMQSIILSPFVLKLSQNLQLLFQADGPGHIFLLTIVRNDILIISHVKPGVTYLLSFNLAYTYVSFQIAFSVSFFQKYTFCLKWASR